MKVMVLKKVGVKGTAGNVPPTGSKRLEPDSKANGGDLCTSKRLPQQRSLSEDQQKGSVHEKMMTESPMAISKRLRQEREPKETARAYLGKLLGVGAALEDAAGGGIPGSGSSTSVVD